MSDEKFEWSEKQPPEWKGDPLGSPVNWAPPSTPPLGATPVVTPVTKVRFGDVMSLTFRTAKAHYFRYFGVALGFSAIAALVISVFAVAQYRAGSLSDAAVQLLVTGDTGTSSDQPLTGEEIEALLSTVTSLMMLISVFALVGLIAQFLTQTILTARALSRMSASPEVASLKFSWLSVLRAQLISFFWLIVFAIPSVIATIILVTGFKKDDQNTFAAKLVLLLVTLMFFMILAIWFAISTLTLTPHAIAKNQGGFKNVAETIRLSKGMRGTSFLVVLVSSALIGLPGGVISTFVQFTTMKLSAETQLVAYFVAQFISAAITIPFTCIAISALYATKQSLNR
jgi:hypothetical protein